MKPHAFLRGNLTAAATVVISLTSSVFGQDGGLDGTFTPFPSVGGLINSAVPLPDGTVLLAGQFNALRRTEQEPLISRYGVAKFTNGGSIDPNYRPNVNGIAYNSLTNPDGTTFVCGAFDKVNFIENPTEINTKTRYRLAKFSAAGVADPLYAPPLQNALSVFSMTAAQGNRLLISGVAGLYMLKQDGTVADTPEFYSYPLNRQGFGVYGTAVRPDQKIFLYGQFGAPDFYHSTGSGVNSNYLDLLSQNGRYTVLGPSPTFIDKEPFSPTTLSAAVHAAVVMPDGKILVGGIFSSPLVGLVKLLPTKGALAAEYAGRPDPDFVAIHKFDQNQPFLDGAVEAIALQADGKILIGGGFTRVRSTVKINGLWRYDTHYGIARLHPDGTLDTTFDAKIQPVPGGQDSFRVLGIALQADGKVLITGTFQHIGASSTNFTYRPLIARLVNNTSPATSVLTTSGNSITWMRGGSAPEATEVIFEYRTPASLDWALVDNLGIATRIPGGWTRTLLTPLPPNTLIRASARTTGGRYNGSSGLVSATTGFQVAKIGLQRDNPVAFIPNNGTTTFQNVGVGRPRNFSFTLSNGGDAGMASISAFIGGPDATQFSISTPPPSTLAVGASAPIEISFNPTSVGTKTATLEIDSNDPEVPTFTVTLNGAAVTGIEGFRYEYFNTIANTGTAADSFDADGDGLTNFFEFVAGLSPTDKTSIFEQRVSIVAGKATVTFSPCLNDRTYQVVTSTNLTGGEWLPATGSTVNNGTERTFTETDPTNGKRFYRVKITPP